MTEHQARQLGRLIAQARKGKGYSLRALSEVTGYPFGWLARLEHGDYQQPAPDRLARLAEALDIPPERLDRITRGHVSQALPGVRTYLRTKYELTPDQITQIEALVATLRCESGKGDEHRS